MSSSSVSVAPSSPALAPSRLSYLDSARAFALVLGVFFHGSLSFSPFYVGWAVQDVFTCRWVPEFLLVSHAFRMGLFFFLAGYFSQRRIGRDGPGLFLRGRLVQLGVPWVLGWFLLRPLLVSGWVMGAASLRGDVSISAGLREGFASLKTLPQGLFTGTHLWFLYYLLLVTVSVVALRSALSVVSRLSASQRTSQALVSAMEQVTSWVARSSWALPVLAVPTAVALGGMDGWGMDTPDRSLWPHWPVFGIYGLFFLVGFALARKEDALDAFVRLTPQKVACLAVGVSLILWLVPFQAQPGHEHFVAARETFKAAYGLSMWSLMVVTMGLFKRFLSRPRRFLRFLADGSYWMYLVHLPLIVWLEVAVAEVPLPGALKLVAIVVATVAVSLVTYRWMVRGTWVGAILRGGGRRPPLTHIP